MGKWAAAKQVAELDWRSIWREVAAGTVGAQPAEVFGLVEQLDCAYRSGDRVEFLKLKARLVNQPSWTGLPPGSSAKPVATSEKSTAPSFKQVSLTW